MSMMYNKQTAGFKPDDFFEKTKKELVSRDQDVNFKFLH